MFGLIILGLKPIEDFQVYGENKFLFNLSKDALESAPSPVQACLYLRSEWEFQKYSCVNVYCTTGNEQAGRVGRLENRHQSIVFTIPKSPEVGDMYVFLELNNHPPVPIAVEASFEEDGEIASPRENAGAVASPVQAGALITQTCSPVKKFTFDDLCTDDKFRAVFMRDLLMARQTTEESDYAALLEEAEDRIAKLERIEALRHGHAHNEKLQDVMEWIATTYLDQIDNDPCVSDQLDQKSAILRGRLNKLSAGRASQLNLSLAILPPGEDGEQDKEHVFIVETFFHCCNNRLHKIRTDARHAAKKKDVKNDPYVRLQRGKEFLNQVDRGLTAEIEQVGEEFPDKAKEGVVFACMKSIYNNVFDLLTWLQSLYFENLPEELMGEGAERTKTIDALLQMLHGNRMWESMASSEHDSQPEDEDEEPSSDLDEDAPESTKKMYRKMKAIEHKLDQATVDIGEITESVGPQNRTELQELLEMVAAIQRKLDA